MASAAMFFSSMSEDFTRDPQSWIHAADAAHHATAATMLAMPPTAVSFQKLPTALCESNAFLIAMFQQAGFEAELLGFQVQRHDGQATGDLLAYFSSKQAAERIMKHVGKCQWGVHAKVQMINEPLRDQVTNMKAGAMLNGDRLRRRVLSHSHAECLPPGSHTPLRPLSGSVSGSLGKFTQQPKWDRDTASTVSDFSIDSDPPVSGSWSPTSSLLTTSTMVSPKISQNSYESDDERKLRTASMPPSPSVRWADVSEDEE
jgi:hypothetical protein